MQKRRLGRTGLEVSQVGFGGTWIAQLPREEASKVVRTAFDLGITYFDTAKLDGDSEEKIGAALKDVRDNCVIATKTGSRTRRESLKDIKESLKRLQTDRVDIIQLHGIDDEATLSKASGEDGVLQTCKEAKQEGFVDFIGITSHKPRVLMKAIESGEFDTVLVPLNVVTTQALEELVPYAKSHSVGVATMKPLSAKTSRLVTCLYNPSLSLLSDEPELHSFLGNNLSDKVQTLLRFVLGQDVAVTIPGIKSVSEAETAARIGSEFTCLTEEELRRFHSRIGVNDCRDCGCCLPCPEGIDIAAILRFLTLAEKYNLTEWARKLYGGLENKAYKCTKCMICEPKCPYNLPIAKRLTEAHKSLSH